MSYSIGQYHVPGEWPASNAMPLVTPEDTPALSIVENPSGHAQVHSYLNNGRVSYFSLPGEIRDKIMPYALVPGMVHPNMDIRPRIASDTISDSDRTTVAVRSSPLDFSKFFKTSLSSLTEAEREEHRPFFDWQRSTSPPRASNVAMAVRAATKLMNDKKRRDSALPGFQLLATCKQAYEEGRVWFYTSNTFYVAPGPGERAFQYFEQLQHENLNLIESIAITFGFADLTPYAITAIEDWMKNFETDSGYGVRDNLGTHGWACWIFAHTEHAWREKLLKILAWNLPSLRTLRLETTVHLTPFRDLEIKAQDLQVSFQGLGDCPHWYLYTHCSSKVRLFMRTLSTEFKQRLEDKITRIGWEATKQWLEEGGRQCRTTEEQRRWFA